MLKKKMLCYNLLKIKYIMSIALVEKLCKYYGESQNAVRALDRVSLSVEQNEFAAVVGTSGKRKVNSHYERYKAVHFAGRE